TAHGEPDEGDVPQVQLREDPVEVVGERVVVVPLVRLVAAAEPTTVVGDHPVPRVPQRRQLLAPCLPGERPAVDEHHRCPGAAGVLDMQRGRTEQALLRLHLGHDQALPAGEEINHQHIRRLRRRHPGSAPVAVPAARKGIGMSSASGALARTTEERVVSERTLAHRRSAETKPFSIITSTDHKVVANLYMVTTFIWFLLAGMMALVMRLELWAPGLQVVDNPEQYNEMFTMHGTIMLL